MLYTAEIDLYKYYFTNTPYSDTVSRSGMFCAIATTIERCKTEGVVDVFQVVKALRIQKPEAVHTMVSVAYCVNSSSWLMCCVDFLTRAVIVKGSCA